MEYGVGVSNRYAFLDDDVRESTTTTEDLKGSQKITEDVRRPQKMTEDGGRSQKITEDSGRSQRITEDGKGSRGKRGGGRGGRSLGSKDDQIVQNEEPFDESRDMSNRGRSGMDFSSRGGGRGSRGRGGRGGRSVDFNDDHVQNEETFDESRDMNNRGRSGVDFSSRGGGRGSQTRGGRGGGFTRRRDFDRASGSDKSGVKPMDKRDGGGAHNWGNYKDEIQEDTESRDTEVVTPDFDTQGENEQGNADLTNMETGCKKADNEETKVDQPAEEVKLLTLEQWKAMQQPRSTPAFNIRKANEGEDPSKWKNLVLKKKEIPHSEDELEYEEGEDIWVPQRAGRQTVIKDIGFHFIDDREERGFRRGPKNIRNDIGDNDAAGGDRGGRGGAGGGGFGRGSRGGRGVGRGFMRKDRFVSEFQRIPRVDDVNDFPSLGGSFIC